MQIALVASLVLVAILLAVNARNPLSTRNILALYGVFVLVRLIAAPREETARIHIEDPLWVATVVLVTCVAVRLGYYWLHRVRGQRPYNQAYSLPGSALFITGIGCQVVGLVGWVAAIASTGFGVLNVAALLSGDTRYLADTPLLLDLAMNLAGAGVAILSLRIKDGRSLVQTFVLSTPSLLLAVALSRRSLIIPLLVFPFFVYWLRVAHVSFAKVVLAALAVLAVSTGLLAMRFYYGFGWERAGDGLQASIASGFLLHFEEADPLIVVIDDNRRMTSVEWARASWSAWVYELVPSGIAGDKPTRLVVPVEVAREYFGLSDKRTGMPATIIGTLLLTGGLPILIVGGLIIGALMSGIDKLLDRWRWDDWGLPIAIWLWMFLTLYVFRLGDLSAAIGQVLVQSIGLLGVLTCLRLIYFTGADERER